MKTGLIALEPKKKEPARTRTAGGSKKPETVVSHSSWSTCTEKRAPPMMIQTGALRLPSEKSCERTSFNRGRFSTSPCSSHRAAVFGVSSHATSRMAMGAAAMSAGASKRKRSKASSGDSLALSGALLETLLLTAPVGFAFVDTDLRYVRFNRALAAMNGSDPQTFIGKTVREVVPHLADQLEPLLRRVLNTNEPLLDLEVIGSGPDEGRSWLEGFYPVRDARGVVLGVGVVVEEITARKRESQMREAALRARLDALPHHAWTVPVTGGRVDWYNRRWYEYTGLTEAEALGDRDARIVHPDDAEELERVYALSVQGKRPFNVEARLRARDGFYRWFVVSGEPMFEQGRLMGWIGTNTDVHERRESAERVRGALEAARRANDRFALAELASGGFVYEWALETGVVTRSDNFFAVMGYALGEVAETAEAWAALVHPHDLEAALQASNGDQSERPREFSSEYRVLHKDGTYRWVWDRGRTIQDAQGRAIRVVGSTVDITERKRAEAALAERETRYRTLFDNIDEGFCICQMILDDQGRPCDYRFLEVNAAFERQTGLRDAVGRTALELIPNLERHWIEIYGRVALTGEPLRFIDGSEVMGRWFDVYALRNGNPQDFQFVLVFNDITERKTAEEALRRSASRAAYRLELSDALRDLENPEAVQAEAARVLMRHLGAQRVVYVDVEENGDYGIVRRDDGLIEPKLAGRYRIADYGLSVANEFRSGRTLVIADVENDPRLTSSERQRYVALGVRSVIAQPLMKDGRLEALVNVNQIEPRAWTAEELTLVAETAERTWTDVERARLHRLLLEREARLREVNEAQRRFVSDAAHELRAPLTAIQGNLELLRRYQVDEEERTEMLRDVHREAERLGRLVNDLLAVARGDAGERLRLEPLELHDVLRDVWRMALRLSAEHRFTLDHLEPCTLRGDEDRLKQLALILLENAVKYTPSGGSVRLESRVDGDWVEFRVTDTGPGIASEELPRVFERFYRVDKGRTRSDDPGGTGLGLPIAGWIAEAHGGRVWLESELGHGTTAIVRLPIEARTVASSA
jgi:PAS domain S-box-containing protein